VFQIELIILLVYITILLAVCIKTRMRSPASHLTLLAGMFITGICIVINSCHEYTLTHNF
jgi:hypothetical protein